MTEQDKLKIIKDILLKDNIELTQNYIEKVTALDEQLNNQSQLSQKVTPIINKELNEFVAKMPETLGPTITKTLQQEIANSKDQVVEALYPIMGKMIKKYVQQEIKLLGERINKQLENSFSAKSWKRRFKSWFGGVKQEHILIAEAQKPNIEQVMVIDKKSGLLLGNYAKSNTIDEQMVSGMLTAIKHFVEDAFLQKNQDLELIEYELYKLHIQNFNSFYVTVVISGNYSSSFKDKLQDKIFDFSEKFLSLPKHKTKQNSQVVTQLLAEHFKNDTL